MLAGAGELAVTKAFVKPTHTTAKMTRNSENPDVPAHEPTKNMVDPPQIVGYPPQTVVKLESGSVSKSFHPIDGTDQSSNDGPVRPVNLNNSEERSEQEQVGKRKTRSELDHSKPEAAKPTRSLRVHLGIKASENGFERIFQDLCCLTDDVGRSQHIKRLLVAIGLGIDVSSWPALETTSENGKDQKSSFNINFRMSTRDSGLEALNTKLCQMPTSTHRNQFVKRLLFNAYISVPKQALAVTSPTQALQVLFPTPALTLCADLNPSPSSVPTPAAKTSTSSKSAENSTTDTTGFGSLDTFTSWATEEETPVSNKDEKRSSSEMSLKRKSSVRGLGT